MGAEETRDAIVQASVKLFAERGYDKTSVQAIIDAVGVSKGGFYHHFSSKEEIVQAITEDYIGAGLKALRVAMDQESGSAVEKLNQLIQVSQNYKSKQRDIRAVIEASFSDDRNLKLEKAIWRVIKKQTVPLFEGILEEGIASGEFQVQDAAAIARVLFHLLRGLKEELREALTLGAEQERLKEIIGVHEGAMCRILGVTEGSIRLGRS